jgi:muramoyltetrapeptide carboxypeptidase
MGVYDQISGMVIGRFPRCVGLHEKDSLNMILDVALKGYKFPVITEFDMGHTDPILTIPIGAKVSINASKKNISLLENVTKV